MAIPTFTAAGAGAAATTTNITPAYPTRQVGDLLFMVTETAANLNTFDPDGWHLLDSVTITGTRLTVYWRRALATNEAAVQMISPGDHIAGAIFGVRGAQSWGIPWNVKATSTASSSTSVSFPSVTTTVPDCLIINIVANGTDTTTTQGSSPANANLTSVTERVDYNTTSGGGGGFTVITGGKATAGSTGSTTMTLATASVQAMLTIAIMPEQTTTKKTVVLTSSDTSWTVPDDWNNNNNTIEALGAGGIGPNAPANARGHGGGGGAYSAITNFSTTPGTSIPIQIGTGGSQTDTYFNDGSTLLAKAGANANGASATGEGAGGAAASGVGTVKYSGGSGGRTSAQGGGGGGGAAGPFGDGKDGGTSNSTLYGGGGGGSNGALATAGQQGASATLSGGAGYLGGGAYRTASGNVPGYLGSGAPIRNNAVGNDGGAGEIWKDTVSGVVYGPSGGGSGGANSTQGGGAKWGGGSGGAGSGSTSKSNDGGLVVITYEPQRNAAASITEANDTTTHTFSSVEGDPVALPTISNVTSSLTSINSSDTNNNTTFRIVIPVTTDSLGAIRVALRSGTNYVRPNNTSFGKWDGNTSSADTTTTPIPLTWQSGNTDLTFNRVSTPPTNIDWVTDYVPHPGFTLVAGDKIVVIFDLANGTTYSQTAFGTISGVETWFKAGTSYNTQNVTGFTKLANTDYAVSAVQTIEPSKIDYKTAKTAYSSKANTSVTAPSVPNDDDIILLGLFLGNNSTVPTPTAPAGFTEVSGSPLSATDGFFNGKYHLFWKRASSETGTYAFTHTTTTSQAFVTVVKGCIKTGDPIDAIATNTGTGSSSTISGVTTTLDNERIVVVAHDWEAFDNGCDKPSGFDREISSLVQVYTKYMPTAGATGTISYTNNNGTGSYPWSMYALALKGEKQIDLVEQPDSTISGDVIETRTANASITEDSDTISSASIVVIKGSSSLTEASDTISSASKLAIAANSSITESNDTTTSAGKISIAANSSITEDTDVLASASTVKIAANSSITETNDSLSATSSVVITANSSITEADDSISSSSIIAAANPPAWVAWANISATTSTTTNTPAIPTSSTGDLLILTAGCINSNVPFTVTKSGTDEWNEIWQGNVGANQVGFWWKRRESTETAPTVTNTGRTSTNLLTSAIDSYTGIIATGTPIRNVQHVAQNSGQLVGSILTTQGRNSLAVTRFMRLGANSASAPDLLWTENRDNGTSGGGAARFYGDSQVIEYPSTVPSVSRGGSNINFGSVTFELIGTNPDPSSLSKTFKRGMWVWDFATIIGNSTLETELLNACSSYGITDLYCYSEATFVSTNATAIKSFIADATTASIKIWGLDGAREYFADANGLTTLSDNIQSVIDYNATAASDEKFYGFHIDCEPADSGSYTSFHNGVASSALSTTSASGVWQDTQALDREYLMRDWVSMHETLQTMCHSSSLQFSTALPTWFDDYFGEPIECTYNSVTQNVFLHIAQYSDMISIMSYNTDIKNVISRTLYEFLETGAAEIGFSVETHTGVGSGISYGDTTGKQSKLAVLDDLDILRDRFIEYPNVNYDNIHDWEGFKALSSGAIFADASITEANDTITAIGNVTISGQLNGNTPRSIAIDTSYDLFTTFRKIVSNSDDTRIVSIKYNSDYPQLSTDKGKTWTNLGTTSDQYIDIDCSSNGQYVYSIPIGANKYLRISNDYGASFTDTRLSGSGYYWQKIQTSNDGSVIAALNYQFGSPTSFTNIDVSTDYGSSWNTNTIGYAADIKLSSDGATIWYLNTSDLRLYENNLTFTSLSEIHNFSSQLSQISNLYVSNDGSVKIVTGYDITTDRPIAYIDTGSGFSVLDLGYDFSTGSILDFAFADSGKIFVLLSFGSFYSTNDGVDWTFVDSLNRESTLNDSIFVTHDGNISFFLDNNETNTTIKYFDLNDLYYAEQDDTSSSNATISIGAQLPGKIDWQTEFTRTTNQTYYAAFPNAGIIFYYNYDLNELYKSTDHGQNWSLTNHDGILYSTNLDAYVGTPSSSKQAISVIKNSDSTRQIAITTDQGDNWSYFDVSSFLATNDFSNNPYVDKLYITDDGNTLIALCSGLNDTDSQYYRLVLKSVDGGSTWAVKKQFSTDFNFVVSQDLTKICIVYGSSAPDYTLEYSTDSGDSWNTGTLFTIDSNHVFINDSNKISLTNSGVLYATGYDVIGDYPVIYQVNGYGSSYHLGTQTFNADEATPSMWYDESNSILYLSTDYILQKTTDAGDNVTIVKQYNSIAGTESIEKIIPSSSDQLYLALNDFNDIDYTFFRIDTLPIQPDSYQEDGDTLSSEATISWQPIVADADIQEQNDTVSSDSKLLITADASITVVSDTVSSTGALTIKANSTITEAGDTLSAAASVIDLVVQPENVTLGAPEVGSFAVEQIYNFTPTTVTVTIDLPEFEIDQIHDLSANGINLPATTVGAVTLNQIHDIDSVGVTLGQITLPAIFFNESNFITIEDVDLESFVISSTVLGQIHKLTNTGVSFGFNLNSPTLGQIQNFTINGVTVSFNLTSPSFGQVHNLTATNLETAFDIPIVSFGSDNYLALSGLIVGPLEISTPEFNQIHNLANTGVTLGQITVPTVSWNQIAHFNSSNVTLGQITVPTVSWNQIAHFSASNVTLGSMTFGTVSLQQVHKFGIANVNLSAPIISNTSIGQVHSFGINDVTIPDINVDNATLQQIHSLSVVEITIGAVEITPVSVFEIIPLYLDSIETGAPTVGSPEFYAFDTIYIPNIKFGPVTFGSVYMVSDYITVTKPALDVMKANKPPRNLNIIEKDTNDIIITGRRY